MNRKQQKIQVRQIKERDSMQAYASAVITNNETAKRISASRLVLNGQLEHDDIILLNSQLAGKSNREQIAILEKWFDWLETKEKYDVANKNGNGLAVNYLVLEFKLQDKIEARKEIESI